MAGAVASNACSMEFGLVLSYYSYCGLGIGCFGLHGFQDSFDTQHLHGVLSDGLYINDIFQQARFQFMSCYSFLSIRFGCFVTISRFNSLLTFLLSCIHHRSSCVPDSASFVYGVVEPFNLSVLISVPPELSATFFFHILSYVGSEHVELYLHSL
jgi:hypothetical protein